MKLEIYEIDGVAGAVEVDNHGEYSWWYNGDSLEVRGVLATVDDIEVVNSIEGDEELLVEGVGELQGEEFLDYLETNLLRIPEVWEVERTE